MKKSHRLSVLIVLSALILFACGRTGNGNGGNKDSQQKTEIMLTENVILGSPEGTSIKISMIWDKAGEAYVSYGQVSGSPENESGVTSVQAGVPLVISLEGLHEDAQYYYQVHFRISGESSFSDTGEYRFHTARAPGSSFSFTVQSDSHMDNNSDPAVYELTLSNILLEKPDFNIDLGDTFMCEKNPTPLTGGSQRASDKSAVYARYIYERSNFGKIAHSVPLFLANGNHEGEAGWLNDGTENNLAVWAAQARKTFFLNPQPDSFYSGDEEDTPYVGKRASWYAWKWGNALFIVLDPYWESTDHASKDPWNLTLGKVQYDWLAEILATSMAEYKFVFIHNLTGGLDGQMRGGIEAAYYFEWGGRDIDGTFVFDQKRPGWAKPIHQLMVDNGVTAVFHGHDHLYARQELDGVIYQEIPQPSAKNYSSGANLAQQYHYASGVIFSSSGHILVNVTPDKITVQYIRTWLPEQETEKRKNGQADDTWSIEAKTLLLKNANENGE
jgi:hypothetical protein